MNRITLDTHRLEWQNNDKLDYEKLSQYIIYSAGSNGTVYIYIRITKEQNDLKQLL